MNTGLIRCAACKRKVSVIAGTIFEGTRKPLRLWFQAMWYVTSQKFGGLDWDGASISSINMDDGEKQEGKDAFFDDAQMKELHNQQVKYVEYLDGLVGGFFKKCPANTHFIITSDHGEHFGEHNYFGHGPIYHEKVFEFPFIEGVLAE